MSTLFAFQSARASVVSVRSRRSTWLRTTHGSDDEQRTPTSATAPSSGTARPRPAHARKSDEHERQQRQPRVPEDREPADGAEPRRASGERRAGRRASSGEQHERRGEQPGRRSPGSCARRARRGTGCSVASDRRDEARPARETNARADLVHEQRRQRRRARSATSPTDEPVPPEDPVDRDEDEAVQRLRPRRRLARDEAERAARDEGAREVVALLGEARRGSSPRSRRGPARRGSDRRGGDERERACGGSRRGASACRAASAASLDVAPLPELEHEQAPEPVRRGRARPLVCSSSRRLTASGRSCPRPRARVVEEEIARRARAARRAATARSGRRSRPCGGSAIPAGRSAANARAQRDLPASRPSRLSSSGSARPSSSDAPVEERRAQLERVRHRGDVRLVEQVAGEVGLDVEPLEPGDPGPGGGPSSDAASGAPISASAASRPELRAQLRREDLHQPPVALGRRGVAAGSSRRAARDGVERGSRRARRDRARRARRRARRSATRRRARRARARRSARSRRTPRRRRRRASATVTCAAGASRDEVGRQHGLVAERLVERHGEPGSSSAASGSSDELLVLRAVALARRRGRTAARRSARPRSRRRTCARARRDACAISATTTDESIPPESSAPSGTSATSRSRTASATVSRTRSSHSSSRAALGRAAPAASSARPVAAALDDEEVAGRELRDAPQRRPGAGHVLEREVGVERARGRARAAGPGAAAAPSARTRTRACRRGAASRAAASCRAGRARARAARARRPRARARTCPSSRSTKPTPCSS